MNKGKLQGAGPGRGEFRRLAAEAGGEVALVPVWRRLAADLETPVGAFLRLAQGEERAFLLESVEGGERIGRWTFMGVRPRRMLESRGGELTVTEGRAKGTVRGDVFSAFEAMLGDRRAAEVAGLPPFTAGAVGVLAYDAVRQLEKLPEIAKDELAAPDALLMFFEEVVAFDHVKKEMVLVAHAEVRAAGGGVSDGRIKRGAELRAAYEAAERRLDGLERRLGRALPKLKRVKKSASRSGGRGAGKVRPRTKKAEFLKAVKRAKEYIAAGDVFQVVLSQRFDVRPEVDPFEVYRALRTVNPSPYLYFLRMGERVVLGSSPEMLVRVSGQRVEYRPIAGTRPRSEDEREDARRAEEMRADEKEVAEHVMLVDLGRNDVGRVSEYGSVRVKELMAVERYSHVMHLVSAIEGKLRPELSAVDALKACFPAGTLSGAPKVRAMEIIEELEPVRRGIYGGAVLYADARGNLDSCIAIRSMYVDGAEGYVQAGAGIVADSVPELEYEECGNKARAVLRAVELARERS